MRRLWNALLVAALLVAAVGASALVPGFTLRSAPFVGLGEGRASSGPVSIEVGDVRLAERIVVDGEERRTTGVFVIVDATIAVEDPVPLVGIELASAGRSYDVTSKGHGEGDAPAPGLPVRGDLVFEIDAALLGQTAEVRAAPGLDASGDLRPQASVRITLDGEVEPAVDVLEVER